MTGLESDLRRWKEALSRTLKYDHPEHARLLAELRQLRDEEGSLTGALQRVRGDLASRKRRAEQELEDLRSSLKRDFEKFESDIDLASTRRTIRDLDEMVRAVQDSRQPAGSEAMELPQPSDPRQMRVAAAEDQERDEAAKQQMKVAKEEQGRMEVAEVAEEAARDAAVLAVQEMEAAMAGGITSAEALAEAAAQAAQDAAMLAAEEAAEELHEMGRDDLQVRVSTRGEAASVSSTLSASMQHALICNSVSSWACARGLPSTTLILCCSEHACGARTGTAHAP